MQVNKISAKVKEVFSLCEDIRATKSDCDVEVRTIKKSGLTELRINVVPELFTDYLFTPILAEAIYLDIYGIFTQESICRDLDSLIIRLNCILHPVTVAA